MADTRMGAIDVTGLRARAGIFTLLFSVVVTTPVRSDWVFNAAAGNVSVSTTYVDAMVKVFPEDDVESSASDISFKAAGGEKNPFQLVLRALENEGILNVFVHGMCDDGLTMDIQAVGYTNITWPVNAANRTGPFPDPLMALSKSPTGDFVRLNGSQNQPLWITITSAAGVKNAMNCSVLLGSNMRGYKQGFDTVSIPVSVQPFGFDIPDERTQLTGAGIHLPVEDPDIELKYYDLMSSRGLNTMVWNQPVPQISLGPGPNISLNTSEFDAAVKVWLKMGFKEFRFPSPAGAGGMLNGCKHVCVNISMTFGYQEGQGTLRKFLWVDEKASPLEMNPEFKDTFLSVYTPIWRHLEATNISNKFNWFQFIDEPDWSDNLTVASIFAIADLFQSINPTLQWSQTRFPLPTEMPAPLRNKALQMVDRWVSHVKQIIAPGTLDELAQLIRRGNVTSTIYNNGVPIIDLPWIRIRSFPWQIWQTNYNQSTRHAGLQGSLSWYSINGWGFNQTNPEASRIPSPWVSGNQDPACLTLKCPYDAGGWGWLLYPPKSLDVAHDAPTSSIRWDLFAKGLMDSEYFYLLDAKVELAMSLVNSTALKGSSCAKAAMEAVRQATSALDKVSTVVWNFTDVTQFIATADAPLPYNDDPKTMHNALDIIGDAIVAFDEQLSPCHGYLHPEFPDKIALSKEFEEWQHSTTHVKTSVQTEESEILFVLGDPQIGFSGNISVDTMRLASVAKASIQQKATAVVIAGDLVNVWNSTEQIESFKRVCPVEFGADVHQVPGNHDVNSEATTAASALGELQHFKSTFGSMDYSVVKTKFIQLLLVNSEFLILPYLGMNNTNNTEVLTAVEEQWQWLEDQLSQSFGATHVAIVMHHPPFLVSEEEPHQYYNMPLVPRIRMMALARKYNVKQMFCGHTHTTTLRTTVDQKVTIYTTAGTSRAFDDLGCGYRVVTANSSHINVDYVTLPNKGGLPGCVH